MCLKLLNDCFCNLAAVTILFQLLRLNILDNKDNKASGNFLIVTCDVTAIKNILTLEYRQNCKK